MDSVDKKSVELWCNHHVIPSKVMIRPRNHDHSNLLKLVSQERYTTGYQRPLGKRQ